LSSTQRMVRFGFMIGGARQGSSKMLDLQSENFVIVLSNRRIESERNPTEKYLIRKVARMLMAQKCRLKFVRECDPYVFRSAQATGSEENFAAHNLDCVATHTYVNHAVIFFPGSHKNPARSLHLDSLLDEYSLIRFRHAVSGHPRRRAACRGPRGGILPVIKNHARMQARIAIYGFARHKIKKPAVRPRQVLLGALR